MLRRHTDCAGNEVAAGDINISNFEPRYLHDDDLAFDALG